MAMNDSFHPRRRPGKKHRSTAVGQVRQLPRLHSLICTGTLVKTSTDPYATEPASRSIPLRGARKIEECIDLIEGFARQCADQPYCTDDGIFIPLFVELSDEAGRLVLCGQVLSRVVNWCPPVQTPAEAKLVQARCMRLHEEILYQDNQDSLDGIPNDLSALNRLCNCEDVLSGRLVDPLWRDEAGKALQRVEMRRMRTMLNAPHDLE
ncbi:hypothetical protein AB6N01_16990 [Alcaligenes nematophilus]|uniref:hypothetical protein n=1 Tax=Alcaligenes nematophilus TaxID=2994643 RepID=UPI0034E0A939